MGYLDVKGKIQCIPNRSVNHGMKRRNFAWQKVELGREGVLCEKWLSGLRLDIMGGSTKVEFEQSDETYSLAMSLSI